MSNISYTYKKLNLTHLEPNKQYTFYKKDKTNFKAIFTKILNDTLIVTNYETDQIKDSKGTCTMPKEWISYVESEEFKIKLNNYLT